MCLVCVRWCNARRSCAWSPPGVGCAGCRLAADEAARTANRARRRADRAACLADGGALMGADRCICMLYSVWWYIVYSMDIQLLHLTTFNGYKNSIIYLFVSVINNYSQNISFANSLKMQKTKLEQPPRWPAAQRKKAERPEDPTPPPGGIGGGCDTRGAESGPGLRRRAATKLIHLHPDTVAIAG